MKYLKLFNSLIIILSLIICINCNNKNSPNKLRAEKGVIDLRNWDFEKYGNVDLEGEWEFYWNEFPEILGREISEDFQFSKKPNYIPVPFEWQNFEVEGKKLPVDGFATYRLKILLPNENRDLKIYMTDVCSAFEFYINKKLHFKRGKIGKIKEENEPSLRYGTFEIQKDDSRELEIYLLISNFHHAKGGFWNKPTLGVSKNIDSFKDTVLSIGYISFGGLFIMGVYHLFLYLLRTKDRSPLYFGIFCILMALRIVSMNERVLMDFFPFLSFLHFYKMEYFTLYGSLPFYLLFIKSLFPDEFLVINTKIINSIAIVGNLIVLFGSPKIYTTWLLLIFQLLILYAIIYSLYVVVGAILNKRMGGYTFLFGNIIFYITLVNDILYGMGVIHTIHMSMYGFLLFIFSQSIILSTKFSRSFTLSENLADELTEKSNNLEIVNNELLDLQKGLEEKVEERGKQIEEIYNKNLLEVQKVNILEKELAVQKERQKIFTDIHDHMGSNILDLSKILNSFSSNVNGDKDNLEKAKLSLSKIEDNLRMKMYSIEDLEIFRKDPINGIRLLIQRRYSIYKREIYFYCDSSLLEMPPEYFSRHKMETLFSISQENANNDLKYGKGESEWNFFPDRDYLCLEIKSETTYDFHSSEIGNGKKNIHLRLKELNGYCFQCLEEGKFHARYFVPLV